jgi:hypothetical protein
MVDELEFLFHCFCSITPPQAHSLASAAPSFITIINSQRRKGTITLRITTTVLCGILRLHALNQQP